MGRPMGPLADWARDRAPLLAALGFLFLAVAILIVVSVIRG